MRDGGRCVCGRGGVSVRARGRGQSVRAVAPHAHLHTHSQASKKERGGGRQHVPIGAQAFCRGSSRTVASSASTSSTAEASAQAEVRESSTAGRRAFDPRSTAGSVRVLGGEFESQIPNPVKFQTKRNHKTVATMTPVRYIYAHRRRQERARRARRERGRRARQAGDASTTLRRHGHAICTRGRIQVAERRSASARKSVL